MRNKIIIGSLAVLAAFAIACGSGKTGSNVGGSQQTGAPAGAGQQGDQGPVTASMGQTVTLTSTFLNDTTTIEVTLSDPKQDTGDGFLSPEHGLYYAVNVTIVCTAGTFTANPSSFKLVATDGTVYDWDIVSSFSPTLSFTDLNVGQRTAGYVVFDVAPDALNGGKIQLDGIGLDYDQPAAYWTL